MNIIKNEIKKIFNPINLILAILVSIIIWVLFGHFNIEYFPNGLSEKPIFELTKLMLENYGPEVDEYEMKEFKKLREDKVKEADKYFSSREEFVKEGVSTYEDFVNIYETNPRPKNQKELEKIHDKVIFEEEKYLIWELQGIDYIIERYEAKEYWVGYNSSKSYKEVDDRYDELEKSSTANSPFSYVILRNYHELIKWVNIMIIISILIIIAPIFVKDKKSGMNSIQYSSNVGRSIMNKKIVSGIISTLIIVSIHLLVIFTIYNSNGTYIFWDCSINSFLSDMQSWYDITYGDYIILTTIMIYVVSICVSMIVMFISSRVTSYMALIGFNIPVLFILCFLSITFALNHLTSLFYPKSFVYVLFLVFIFISIAIYITMVKIEGKTNV